MPRITSTFAPATTAVPSAIFGRPAVRPVHLQSPPSPRHDSPARQRWGVRRPGPPSSECSPLKRELAFGNAGSDARASELDQRPAAQRPGARFESSRIDPLNREPAATPAPNAAFESSRIDPLNREPAATPAPDAAFEPSRIDPLNREPAAPSPNATFESSRIDPLNREPAAAPSPNAAFESSRIDPLNREPASPSPNATFEPSRIDPLNREPAAPGPNAAFPLRPVPDVPHPMALRAMCDVLSPRASRWISPARPRGPGITPRVRRGAVGARRLVGQRGDHA